MRLVLLNKIELKLTCTTTLVIKSMLRYILSAATIYEISFHYCITLQYIRR